MHPDIHSVAAALDLSPHHLLAYGTDKAKVSLDALTTGSRKGKLILVSAITPTPAGEGKTTVSIGLAQGLQRIGQSTALALRQPSMGPVFGRKGGATGGGKSIILPAEAINLHFTGDFHAVTSAHNLLSAAIDNDLHFHRSRLAPDEVLWKRVLDVNDRALRRITVAKGSTAQHTSGFDITAASEIMAILCLAESYTDLRERLDRIVVGFTAGGDPVFASEFRITGSLMALLKDALLPNLVQSLEGVPTFLHGGPFANIAHGCNSVLATRMALAHADFVVTECGFAFDLGGEKFLGIKCRQSGLSPEAIVIVATVRALKMHGGAALDQLTTTDLPALDRGLQNLAAHLDSASQFERPVIVAINQFHTDTAEELATIQAFCQSRSVPCAIANVFAQGGAGATDLAETLLAHLPTAPAPLPFLYQSQAPVPEKLHAIATRIYGARSVQLTADASSRLQQLETAGLDTLPICMAKTQNSLSDDPHQLGRPTDFDITVRDFEIANGAGFLVALTGTMMRMPALPKLPAAESIDLSADGRILGASFPQPDPA
jgi:formate--tetrahydrofolate ligase